MVAHTQVSTTTTRASGTGSNSPRVAANVVASRAAGTIHHEGHEGHDRPAQRRHGTASDGEVAAEGQHPDGGWGQSDGEGTEQGAEHPPRGSCGGGVQHLAQSAAAGSGEAVGQADGHSEGDQQVHRARPGTDLTRGGGNMVQPRRGCRQRPGQQQQQDGYRLVSTRRPTGVRCLLGPFR